MVKKDKTEVKKWTGRRKSKREMFEAELIQRGKEEVMREKVLLYMMEEKIQEDKEKKEKGEK